MKTIHHQAAAFAFILLFTLAGIASAHAFVDRAEPKVGSEVRPAPAEVKVWLTQEVEPAFSKIQVFDSAGNEVDKKDSHLDSADKHLIIVSLPPVAAGTYKVVWRVISVDTHKTQGDFKFVVK